MQHRRRSLLFVIVTMLALVIAVFISGRLSAPESTVQNSPFKDGEVVNMTGDVVCLQHVSQNGPITLECAYGFKELKSGTYYALLDNTQNYQYISNASMNKQVRLSGIYRESTDDKDKYVQSGTIEITSLGE
jgi:hypothetical protein